VQLRNPLEGVSSGTVITGGPGNSGASGTAFDSVTGAPTYDNTVLVKSGNAAAFTSTVAATVSLNWTTALGGSFARLAGVCYFQSTSFSVANMVVRLRDGSGNQIARIVTDTSGHVVLRVNTGNTLIGTTTAAMSTGTTYRIEWDITSGATAPVAVYLYLGDSTTLLDSVTSASANSGAASIGEINWGIFTSTASVPLFRLDELAVSDAAGLIGPTIPTPAPMLWPLPTVAYLVVPLRPVISRSSLIDVVAAPPGAPVPLVVTTPGRLLLPAQPILSRSSLVDVPALPTPAPKPVVSTVLGLPLLPARAILSRSSLVDVLVTPAPAPVPLVVTVGGLPAALPRRPVVLRAAPAAAAVAGAPFLPGVLPAARIYVEIAFGADLTDQTGASWSWTDVTGDVMYEQQVSITQGRADETSQASPASCGFTLLNTAGDYSPYSPASAYWPGVRRNTPVRVRVDPGDGGGARVRFLGYAAGFTPVWDATAAKATVDVTAAGVIRRLTQGKTPLRSAIFRAGTQSPAPAFGWSFEDGSDATQLAPSIVGGPSMTVRNAGVSLGVTDALLPGAAAVIKLAPDVVALPGTGQVMGTIPAYVNTGYLGIRIWQRVSDGTGGPIVGGETVAFSLAGPGSLYHATISLFGPGFVPEVQFAVLGTGIGAWVATGVDPTDGAWHETFVGLTQSGADVLLRLYVDGVLGASATIVGETLDPISRIWINGDMQTASGWRVSASGLQVYTDPTAAPRYAAGAGYVGETATDRMARLAAEQGVALNIIGTSATTMGPQLPAAFVDLLRECEDADGGLLYDGAGPGLGYVCRSNRYNEPAAITLDMAADPPQVDDPFSPVDDDQRNRNDVTVSRSGGSSARYIDQSGPLGTDTIGVYDTSVTLNLSDDTELLNQAGWRVHLGTVEGLRYPTLSADLAAVPALATTWLALTLTGRVDVVNVTSRAVQHPPDDLALGVEGWTEVLGTYTWAATANCSPHQPWHVAELQSTTDPFQLDTGGSQLHAAVTTTDVSWQVDTTVLPLWTTTATYPADFPFDINVNGERVRVTAIVGTSSPQTFTVTRSINDVVAGHDVGTPISLWFPAVLAL
jgi:hypothetical protein